MILDPSTWPRVALAGVLWAVCPTYCGPVGISEAAALAASYGCELPSPKLVDAIYAQADCKLDALKFVRSHDGTPKTMASKSVLEAQKLKIETALGDWVKDHGPFTLSAGYGKDVVRTDSGKLGLYGWFYANGKRIQPLFTGHSHSWIDYSRLCRLVKKVGE